LESTTLSWDFPFKDSGVELRCPCHQGRRAPLVALA
jgi:hypothetical protein